MSHYPIQKYANFPVWTVHLPPQIVLRRTFAVSSKQTLIHPTAKCCETREVGSIHHPLYSHVLSTFSAGVSVSIFCVDTYLSYPHPSLQIRPGTIGTSVPWNFSPLSQRKAELVLSFNSSILHSHSDLTQTANPRSTLRTSQLIIFTCKDLQIQLQSTQLQRWRIKILVLAMMPTRRLPSRRGEHGELSTKWSETE